MKSFLFVVLFAAALIPVASAAPINATEIECEEGKTGCSECYITLVKSLMYSSENVYNLTKAFLLPRINVQIPVFVTVTYQFPGKGNKTWYWTSETSTLLHPLEGFQFFSFFFGNYKEYQSGEVAFTLPSECFDATPEYFRILTQRLKVHAQTLSITPMSQDSDNANSGNVDYIEENIHSDELAAVLYLYHIFVPIFLTIGVGLLTYVNINFILPEKRSDEQRNATAFSISIFAFIVVLYAIGMDICGIAFAGRDSVPKYSDKIGKSYTRALFFLPLVILTIYDLLAFILYLFVFRLIFYLQCYKINVHSIPCEKTHKGDRNDCKSFTDIFTNLQLCCVFFPILVITFVLSNHSYFIIIGFVNDPKHANSIGIYYVITCLVWLYAFRMVWTIFIDCCKVGDDEENGKPNEPVVVAQQNGNGDVAGIRNAKKDDAGSRDVPVTVCPSVQKATDTESNWPIIYCQMVLLALVVLVVVILLAGLQILISATVVYVPIRRTIEDVPAQLSSIYQSLFVVFGALITYQLFFKKDKRLDAIVKHALIAHAKSKNNNKKKKNNTKLAKNLIKEYLKTLDDIKTSTHAGE